MTAAFTLLGWAVVHALWTGALIAGLAACVLSWFGDRHARARELVAAVGLVLMVVVPIAAAVGAPDPLTPAIRMPMTRAIDGTIDLSAILRWRSIVVRGAAGVWLVGFAIAAARVGVEWRRAQALRREGLDDAGDEVRAVVADLRARLLVSPPVDVRGSSLASVPMVLGWRRPIVLLPLTAVRALRSGQVRAVLAHELAHVYRRDYLVNLWQMAAETLLFFHPGAWWLSRRVRTEREYGCDDVAVAVGGDAGSYARALAALEDTRGECRLAVAAASGTLLDRIRRIVGAPRPTLTPARAVAALVLTSIVAIVIFAGAMIIPPAVPLDAQMRRRAPAPPGAQIAPPPGAESLPRKSQR